MAAIGDPIKVIEIQPVEVPIPKKTPKPDPVPQDEPVEVPA